MLSAAYKVKINAFHGSAGKMGCEKQDQADKKKRRRKYAIEPLKRVHCTGNLIITRYIMFNKYISMACGHNFMRETHTRMNPAHKIPSHSSFTHNTYLVKLLREGKSLNNIYIIDLFLKRIISKKKLFPSKSSTKQIIIIYIVYRVKLIYSASQWQSVTQIIMRGVVIKYTPEL